MDAKMSEAEHPSPWYLDHSGGIFYVFDADGRCVCSTTADRETRILLLHAAEMWEALKRLSDEANSTLKDKSDAEDLVDKIESEIAAARKP